MSALGVGVLGSFAVYNGIGLIPGLILNIAIVISFMFTAFLMVFAYFKTNKNLT
jgi:hypothetical protein